MSWVRLAIIVVCVYGGPAVLREWGAGNGWLPGCVFGACWLMAWMTGMYEGRATYKQNNHVRSNH